MTFYCVGRSSLYCQLSIVTERNKMAERQIQKWKNEGNTERNKRVKKKREREKRGRDNVRIGV